MFKGFRDFILRGNVIDLAVAVIMGAAFTAIVGAIAKGLITPLIALIFGQPDASALNSGIFLWGDIITAIINFLIIAVVVYFLIVVPMNKVMERFKREEKPAEAEPSNEEKLLAEIRDALLAQRGTVRDGTRTAD
jgi:large conductance mechanosensitive channel